MDVDVIGMLDRIAENGTAPVRGCSLFGVGYDAAFGAIRRTYFERAFARGRSTEKYVVGAYGSGKTHFLRQLVEIAQTLGCVTAEVALTKDLDYTQTLIVYQQVANSLRVPGKDREGMDELLRAMLDRVGTQAPSDDLRKALVSRWIPTIESWNLKSKRFQRVLRHAFEALDDGNEQRFEKACRWLSGEVKDRTLAKEFGEQPLTKDELSLHGREALLSLGQAVKKAPFRGTVIGFDEAEQGLSEGIRQARRRERVLSMLQSSINATTDLEGGATLIVYAITPDVWEEMSAAPMLQQRVSDPGPGQGFLDGNPRAVKIPLDENREDPVSELKRMGAALVDVLYRSHAADMKGLDQGDALSRVAEMAEQVAVDEPSVSSRRIMMKRVATMLMNGYETGAFDMTARVSSETEPE